MATSSPLMHVCYVLSNGNPVSIPLVYDTTPLLLHPQRTRFVTLSDEERAELQLIAGDPSQSHARRGRANVLLLADNGPHGPALSFPEISRRLDRSRAFVSTVVARAADRGALAATLARIPKSSVHRTDP